VAAARPLPCQSGHEVFCRADVWAPLRGAWSSVGGQRLRSPVRPLPFRCLPRARSTCPGGTTEPHAPRQPPTEGRERSGRRGRLLGGAAVAREGQPPEFPDPRSEGEAFDPPLATPAGPRPLRPERGGAPISVVVRCQGVLLVAHDSAQSGSARQAVVQGSLPSCCLTQSVLHAPGAAAADRAPQPG